MHSKVNHPAAPPGVKQGGAAYERRGSRRVRGWWIRVIVGAVALALTGVAAVAAWNWYRWPARIAMAMPALPEARVVAAELQENLRQARVATLRRGTALEGVVEFGRLCHANGFMAEAEACWRIMRREQPREARWCYYLADVQRHASDYEEMAAGLERTTEFAPTYAAAWLQLANLHFKRGQLNEAEGDYRRRLALLPGDPHARLGLARVAWQQGRHEPAREIIALLVKDAPGFAPGHNLYAEMLAAAGDEAGSARERFLGSETRFRPADDPWLDELITWCYDYEQLCVRGFVDATTGRAEEARARFQRAIELRPDALPAYEALGSLYLTSGDAARARETYEQALRRAPAGEPAATLYANLSRAHGRLQQWGEAERVARTGLERAGGSLELYDALGDALGARGEREAAVEALRAAVAIQPGNANANHKLAVALLAVHRLDDALAALQRALAAQPTFPATLALLGQIAIDSGHWEEAVRYLRPLYESNPQLPEAREKMTFCHLRAGVASDASRDFVAAERHYRAGLAIEPGHAELLTRLGALLLIQRRFADAIEPLEAGRRVQPDHAQTALFLGQAYVALGRRDEAGQVLQHGLRLAERDGSKTMAAHFRELLQRL